MLVNITGGHDLTLDEVGEAMDLIHDAADPDAKIILGTVLDEKMQDEMKITVIATGFDRAGEMAADKVQPLSARQTPGASVNTRGSASPSNSSANQPGTPSRSTDDLDVPTFIRKKAD